MVQERLPLSALLSQTLIAFTIEFDNEFERQMIAAGFRGIGLSLLVWSNLLRFLPDHGVEVGHLTANAYGTPERILHMLACLERWRFVEFDAPKASVARKPLHAHRRTGRLVRDGYGSSRGVRRDWIVKPTSKGRCACALWPLLFELIEQRWRKRFGEDEIQGVRTQLQTIVEGIDLALPDAVPQASPQDGLETYRPRTSSIDGQLLLVTLLSKVLIGCAVEFNREADAPLVLAANVLRCVTNGGVRVGDLAGCPDVRRRPVRLVGGTRQMAAQTAACIDDPAGTLPHYPMWDMNRGFGP